MMKTVLTCLVLPVAVAGAAVLARTRGPTIQWFVGSAVAGVLTFLWFRIATPPQPWPSFLFVVILPVALTFSVASQRRLPPALAFGIAIAACLAGAALGIVLGVNAEMLRP